MPQKKTHGHARSNAARFWAAGEVIAHRHRSLCVLLSALVAELVGALVA